MIPNVVFCKYTGVVSLVGENKIASEYLDTKRRA
jgi:hypothetical protein